MITVITQTDNIHTGQVVINRSFLIETIKGFHVFNERIAAYYIYSDSDSDSDSD